MVKVAFWSLYRKRGGVTANMLALAFATSQYFRARVGVRSNHLSNGMLEYYLSETNHRVRITEADSESYSRDVPQYIHYLNRYYENIMNDFKKDLSPKKEWGVTLYRPPEPFEEELYPGEDEDIMLLDVSGKNNSDSQKAMEDADVIVFFLPPSIEEIKSFFSTYPMPKKKTFYVVNGCTEKDDFSPNAIRSFMMTEYKVRSGAICFIPYYEKLKRACHLGEIDLLMEDEIKPRKRSLYYRCIKELGKKLLKCKYPGQLLVQKGFHPQP